MTLGELIEYAKHWEDIDVMNILFVALMFFLVIFTVWLMFFWENKVRWWMRLPVVNLVIFVILLIMGIIQEIYLTFHPKERTTFFKSSIFQLFFS